MTPNDPYRIYTVGNHPRFIFAQQRRSLSSAELHTMLDEAKQLCPKRIIIVQRQDGTWTSLSHENLLARGNETQAAAAWDRAQRIADDKAARHPTPRRILG